MTETRYYKCRDCGHGVKAYQDAKIALFCTCNEERPPMVEVELAENDREPEA